MKTILKFILFVLLVTPLLVFAQSTTTALVEAVAEIAPAAPAWLTGVQVWIESNLLKFGTALGLVLHVVLGLIPSKKPMGVLHGISASVKVLVAILDALVGWLDKAIQRKK